MTSPGERRPDGPPAPAGTRLVLGAHWGLPAFFAGLAGFHLLTLLLAVVVHSGRPGSASPELAALGPVVLVVFLPHVFMALGPLLGARRWGAGVRVELPLLPTARDLRIGLFFGVLALGVGIALNLLTTLLRGRESAPGNPLDELAEGLGGNVAWLIVLALIVVLAIPVAEELLVRGSLWAALAHHRIPGWAIVVLTALVFAYLHEDQARTFALFGQGLMLGAARLVSGRLPASVVAHAVNNLLPALVLVFSA